MSQAGLVDIESSHPQIPTTFVADVGSAVPLANVLEILGTTVANYGTPLETTGSGNTITIVGQYAASNATSVAGLAGVSSFNSSQFTVDANGFVSITASGSGSFAVDASTAPGTNPVLPNGSGVVTVTGGQVAAGTTTNVIRTDSLAANTYTIQIQRSQAVASSTIGDNGVSHFNSTYFTVDANGFVSLNGSGVGETITGNTGGALSPTAGNWNILGTSTAAGTTPVQTSGSGSTLTVQIQKTQAIASTNATNVGLAAFDSNSFTVDANGFVQLIGGASAIEKINVQTGTTPIVPSSGSVTMNGAVVAAGVNPVRTHGTGANTWALEVQTSQAIAATDATKIGLSNFNSAQFTVDANGFVSASGALATTYTENSGTATPSSGNLNILGTNSALTGFSPWTTGAGATVTLNMPGTAKWVVNPTANLGTHTTISSALTSASSGDTIFICPGTYTENPTLKAGVNLTAFGSDSSLNGTGHVIISGTCTLTTAGSVTISGIQLQTNSAALLAVTGSVASIVNLQNCYLNCSNNTGITFSSSSASAAINLMNCEGNLGTTGIGLFSHSSAGLLTIQTTSIYNTGGSSTASTISAGSYFQISSGLAIPITSSGTAALGIFNGNNDTSATNTTALTIGGSGISTLVNNYFTTGSASSISISSSATISSCTIASSNTNAITGAGTITYSALTFIGSSSTINTTTQTASGTLQGSRNTAPSAGFLGEQIRNYASAVSITNNSPINITSISLTAGVWDLSGIGEVVYTGSTVATQLAISANSASLTGTVIADSSWQSNITLAAGNVSASIPSFRVIVSATTTYYLVGVAFFTTGTASAYGRLSATRVG